MSRDGSGLLRSFASEQEDPLGRRRYFLLSHMRGTLRSAVAPLAFPEGGIDKAVRGDLV